MSKMQSVVADIQQLVADFTQAVEQINLSAKAEQLNQYQQQIESADFWHKPTVAQVVSTQHAQLKTLLEPWLTLRDDINSLQTLIATDEQLADDQAGELATLLTACQTNFANLKQQLRFSQPYDDKDAILSLFAGAGGDDAQDWASMLLRMYERWAEQHQVQVELLSHSRSEVGIKSVSLRLSQQPFLYGRLKGEDGVHRLVRLSPFNAQNLRQTSFAKVEILPVLDQPEIELKETDLRIDFFKSGGHGGQSVNTTDSAVRITHLPTQLTVTIQNERRQAQNRDLALSVLHSRLTALRLAEHAQTIDDLRGVKLANEWGNQIRNYVLHPYRQVKDLRSGYTSNQVNQILDGQIDALLEASLESNLKVSD